MKKKPAQQSIHRVIEYIPQYLVPFFIACVLLILPGLTFAADVPAPTPLCPPDQTITEVGCLSTDPITFVSSFYGIGLSIIGGVALLFIIFGSYIILTARNNPNQVNIGKSYIFYALLGLIMAIFGYLFLEVVLVDILQIPGFGK